MESSIILLDFYYQKKNNSFFGVLKRNVMNYLDVGNYQSIGSNMLNSIHNYIQSDLIYNIGEDVMYSYNHITIDNLFNSKDTSLISDSTIGVHWYNGADVSKKFNNKYSEGNADIINGITLLIEKYKII